MHTPIDSPGLRTQIDRFLRSLAEDQHHNAVCILLSGTGTDGMLGLKAIKEQGGMAMAQEPESAKHDTIPRSAIATGLVDYVLPVERMPATLIEYAKHLRALRGTMDERVVIGTETDDQMRKICELLRLKTGHDFSRYKTTTLIRRIQRRMQVQQRDTYLVALTGYGWESDQRQAQEAGFDSHLIKPAHPETLQRLIVNLSHQ